MLQPLLSGVTVGFAPSYTNNASAVLNAKYVWGTRKDLYESVVGSSVVLGFCIGAAIGGKLV